MPTLSFVWQQAWNPGVLMYHFFHHFSSSSWHSVLVLHWTLNQAKFSLLSMWLHSLNTTTISLSLHWPHKTIFQEEKGTLTSNTLVNTAKHSNKSICTTFWLMRDSLQVVLLWQCQYQNLTTRRCKEWSELQSLQVRGHHACTDKISNFAKLCGIWLVVQLILDSKQNKQLSASSCVTLEKPQSEKPQSAFGRALL